MEVRGWSVSERARAAQILEQAENAKHPHVKHIEHLHFWLLLLIIFLGNLCCAILAFPALIFGSFPLGLALMFLLGVCMGLLMTHALRSLQVPRTHHLRGVIILAGISLAAKTYAINVLQLRFRIIPGVHLYSAFLLALAFVIGMLIPYFTERRLHGPA